MSTVPEKQNSSDRHFEILKEQSKVNAMGVTLYRIQATIDSYHAKKGEIGGWVESYDNIVGNNAWVANNAEVCLGATVRGKSIVQDDAKAIKGAKVGGWSSLENNALLIGSAMFGRSIVGGNAIISNGATVFFNAYVGGQAKIRGANIGGSAHIAGTTIIDRGFISILTDKPIMKTKEISLSKMFPKSYDKPSFIKKEEELHQVKIEKAVSPEDRNHFELTNNYIVTSDNEILYQIRATKEIPVNNTFGRVSKGDLGGYVASKDNLINDAWVGKNISLSGDIQLNGGYLDTAAKFEIMNMDDIKVAEQLTRNKVAQDMKRLEKQEPIIITM